MPREYRFAVPYRVAKLDLTLFAARIVAAELWEKLPRRLAVKLNEAINARTSVILTKKDLDSIEDDVWGNLSQALALEWAAAPTQRTK